MSLVGPLDVIIIFDDTTNPPKPKFVVCVAPNEGFFFRLNSIEWPVPVCILKVPDHGFLDHDSYLQCDGPLELDDYLIEEALRRHGLIGTLNRDLIPQILNAMAKNGRMTQADRKIIEDALAHLCE